MAPNLSITFNQPMVALTGIGDLAKQDVPVKLSPQPDGPVALGGHKDTLL